MDELSRVLWRERELLDMLLFKLEEEQLVLASGRRRWLAYTAREVQTVLDSLRQTQLLRATCADAAAAALGIEASPTLDALAHASEEPWPTILLDHREAFRSATAQIAEIAAARGELFAAAVRYPSDCGETHSLGGLAVAAEAENADIAHATMDRKMWEVVSKAAGAAATNRLLQPSLIEFLCGRASAPNQVAGPSVVEPPLEPPVRQSRRGIA